MTTSAVVWAYLFLHIGVIIVVTAYFTVGSVLTPNLTGRARERFARRPWLPAVIGLAISIPWVITAIILLSAAAAAAKFVGAVFLAGWVLCGLVGGAGIAQHIGRAGASGDVTWAQTFRGGLLVCLTWVLPLVGWLVMLPLTLATGIGCLVLGLFPMRATAPVAISPVAAS